MMKKEYKKIGFVKCPVCGERITIKEANNAKRTPWLSCGKCQYRGYINGWEGEEILLKMEQGVPYRTTGGLVLEPLNWNMNKPVPEVPAVPEVKEEPEETGVGCF